VNARKIASFLAISMLSIGFFSPEYRAFASLPSEVTVPAGDSVLLRDVPGFRWAAHGGVRDKLSQDAMEVSASSRGEVALTLGGVPLKRVAVHTEPRHVVTLGGQAIGVVVHGDGTTVVGLDRIFTTEGTTETPAKVAGLRVGDRLISIDGIPLREDRELAPLVDAAGAEHRAVRLQIMREGKRLEVHVHPSFDRVLGRYRLGVFVRDHVTGVGTLTFSDPASGRFAALGHRVTLAKGADAPAAGFILPAAIVGVQRAQRGKPGQKIGVIGYGSKLGKIERNKEVGVGGALEGGHLPGKRMPLASVSQVHPGSATLYTVFRDGGVRPFHLEIERVVTDRRAGAKSLVLRVTDRHLLRLAGGIVQGMSGSPIVQDGRVAGAVTHVFIHDPTRGYGTFAVWMYEDLVSKKEQSAIVRQAIA
jgi:stage IV sporulation protein B